MTKPISREKILGDVQTFCDSLEISPTEFGQRALNDPAFFGRLKSGKNPTLDRIERIYDYMARSAPKGGLHDIID